MTDEDFHISLKKFNHVKFNKKKISGWKGDNF